MPTVRGMGEQAIIASMLQAFGTTSSAHSSDQQEASGYQEVVANGDDAAVFSTPGPVAATIDTAVEGQDFVHEWPSGARTEARMVGFKTAAQNLSDLNAMGAIPRSLLVSLSFPQELDSTWPAHFAAGMRQACAELGADHVSLIGGDLSAARDISITITALGNMGPDAAPLTRSAAQPGDTVWLAGRGPGYSGAALEALLHSAPQFAAPQHAAYQHSTPRHSPEEAQTGQYPLCNLDQVCNLGQALEDHFQPQPPLTLGPQLAALSHQRFAAIDTSDGLVRDASRIGHASGVSIELDSEAIQGFTRQLAQHTGLNHTQAQHHVLFGGEDFGLLFTTPPEAAGSLPAEASIVGVGTVRQSNEPGEVTLNNQTLDPASGFDHYTADQNTAD